MGKSTIVYRGPSNQPPIDYLIWGFRGENPSGFFIASGTTVSGSPVTIQVSGFDTYQFCLYTSGVVLLGTPFYDDNPATQVIVLFGATG